jgi:guanylate kinase
VNGSRRGLLVIVSGPAGVGKTTICDQLLRLPNFTRSISATTRLPRPGERDEVDYIFMNQLAFEDACRENRFLEWANVHGRYYGTPRGPVEQHLRQGRNVILNIDVQGAAQIRGSGLPLISFFLLPPNRAALEERIRRRNQDSPAEIDRRLREADVEMGRAPEYDYQIVNDEIGRTVQNIVSILEQRGIETEQES